MFIDSLYVESMRNRGAGIFASFKYDPVTFQTANTTKFPKIKDYLRDDGTIRNGRTIPFKGENVPQKVLDYKIEEPNKEDDFLIVNPMFITACIIVINELFINIKNDGKRFKVGTSGDTK